MKRVHGGWGVGERKDGGERLIDLAVAFTLPMMNTFFEKRIKRLITYSSGGMESQIDLLLCKRDHLMAVRNCKVINGETVAAKHRLVVIDCILRNCRRSKKTRMDPKIKRWKLKEAELRVLFKGRVLEAVRLHEDVQEWWIKNIKVILRIGGEVLGKSSGRRPLNDEKSWWWNDEGQERHLVQTASENLLQFQSVAGQSTNYSGQDKYSEAQKIRPLKNTIRPIATYGCETWRLTKELETISQDHHKSYSHIQLTCETWTLTKDLETMLLVFESSV
ncbi:uncharacterized protein [Palaemon carinicauda]|uniref:uncharacterized protein n=1 Tax=Palaemon carinicauda TaxID=392227 RepID=UPI0035B6187C